MLVDFLPTAHAEEQAAVDEPEPAAEAEGKEVEDAPAAEEDDEEEPEDVSRSDLASPVSVGSNSDGGATLAVGRIGCQLGARGGHFPAPDHASERPRQNADSLRVPFAARPGNPRGSVAIARRPRSSDTDPRLSTACENSKACHGFKHHFEECAERVTSGKVLLPGENCVEELCESRLSQLRTGVIGSQRMSLCANERSCSQISLPRTER